MARSGVARKRGTEGRTKVKTGCATCRSVAVQNLRRRSLPEHRGCSREGSWRCQCLDICRIRKIKCDETKPVCQKCVSTGRTCDGYESTFRIVPSRPVTNTRPSGNSPEAGLQSVRSISTEITPRDIDFLDRCFSVKTMFDVKLGCYKEARQVLEASLTDPPIRHAVLSLKALREDFEKSGDSSSHVTQQNPSFNYGLQQYNLALAGLASNLSSPDINRLKSALLCCQIFISIEQVQANYAAMAQHIIRGLRVMRECRARPHIVAANKLEPAHREQLPLLDVFIIKLFIAPCGFSEHPATIEASEATPSCVNSAHQRFCASRDHRTIAPNMRKELVRIAESTLAFLDKVSQIQSVEDALRLLPEKAALLACLEAWFIKFGLVQAKAERPGSEHISETFLRFFHVILNSVLLGALDSSPDLDAELRAENERLHSVANSVGEKVRSIRIVRSAIGSQDEQLKLR